MVGLFPDDGFEGGITFEGVSVQTTTDIQNSFNLLNARNQNLSPKRFHGTMFNQDLSN